PHAGERGPLVRVRCFGGLAIDVAGKPLPLDGLRPRAREVLRLLLLRAPHAVHREVLFDALWPHLRLDRAGSSLHVALSALRHALDDVPGLSIERDGDAYALRAGPEAEIDLLVFRGATAGGAGMAAPRTALDLYAGDLFPEEGPAEWIVEAREQLRERAAHAALFLAEQLLDDDPRAAAAACERGLELDRHLDDLWRLLADAYVTAGLPAAAARAARRYDDVLADLGVELPISTR
ncbi:MAG: winged helix-turn-helix domain-containing protein, partial [Actinomycetota bacterium]|nr:winged helix-turn-helix domain-containing protein [Actinomycetota bacterium]